MAVYIIEDGLGHVKVGKSRDALKRIASHQTSNPNDLKIIAILRGYTLLEEDIKKSLEPFQVEGKSKEWFYYNDECKKVIKEYIEKSDLLESRKGLDFFGVIHKNLKEHHVQVEDSLDFLNAMRDVGDLNIFVSDGYSNANIGSIFVEIEKNCKWIWFNEMDSFPIMGCEFYIREDNSFGVWETPQYGGGYGKGYLTTIMNYNDKRKLCPSVYKESGLTWLLNKIKEYQNRVIK